MTREEKIAKARKMRGEGKTAGEIAFAVQAPESTVRNWYLGGNCEVCGAAVDGSSGAKSSTHCPEHAAAAVRARTKERLIAEMHRWVAEFDRAPSATDWNPYKIKHHPSLSEEAKTRKIERHRTGNWPWASSVIDAFGSWSAGLKAAGVRSNPAGRPGRWEEASHRSEQVAA